jgi:hypothetical protein
VGRFSHENTIHVPYFYQNANKTVVMGFEDGDETESEVYMYVADSPAGLLHGNGQIYVFGADDNSTYNTWDDIYYNSNGTKVDGKFIPLKWDYKTQNETDLNAESVAVGGFQFIRQKMAQWTREQKCKTFYIWQILVGLATKMMKPFQRDQMVKIGPMVESINLNSKNGQIPLWSP